MVLLKDFARTQAITEGKFKIVFLDEADELTPEAQAALRRTMEEDHKHPSISASILWRERFLWNEGA